MASGTESATETSYWLKFFTDAHIPAGDAAHYAVLFSDNRIQRGMLLDLTKEYLTDMGISRLGDVIAILKHARTVHDQDAKDKALKGAKYSTSTSSPSRRSTAASRMVDHFLAKTPDSAPMNQPPPPKPTLNTNAAKKSSVFDRLGADSSGSGSSPKSTSGGESVFSRLGGKAGQKRAASSTSPGDSDDDGSPQSPLGYHGILKFSTSAKNSPSMPRKKIRVTVDDDPVKVTTVENVKVTGLNKVKVTGLDRVKMVTKGDSFDASDIQPLKVQVSSTTVYTQDQEDCHHARVQCTIQKAEVTTTTPLTRTAGVLSMDAPVQTASVKTRLGPKVQKAAASSTTSGFGPTTKAVAASDVKSRLGAKSSQPAVSNKLSITTSSSMRSRPGVRAVRSPATSKLTITTSPPPKAKSATGVFSRLGKKSSVS
ncbi:uncharacterized protein LOC143281404 [Babylonia areolata]|uniref:uncharacterized protein LOC143281404 n=1 Tax=Babylonia areolata TaxID=304850 RepID=UPI003FCF446D